MSSKLLAFQFFGFWINWCLGCAYWNWRTWKRWRSDGNSGIFFGREIDRMNYPYLFQIVSSVQLLGVAGALLGALAGFFFLSSTLGIE
jgi:hypothetical protein